jgi:hypothetical protein
MPSSLLHSICLFALFLLLMIYIWRINPRTNYGRRKPITASNSFPRTPPKPLWVQQEVLKLKALMPDAGCRTLALIFNRRHQTQGMTVGKSYVHDAIRSHQYEIQILRREIKRNPPNPCRVILSGDWI